MQNDPGERSFVERCKPVLACLLIVAAVLIVYSQVVTHDFISYDDGIYVTNNEYVKAGLSLSNIRQAFSLEGCSNRTYYHPVTWLSHMLDVELYGLDPGMHHLTNVFLHALNTALLFSLLFSATGSLWASVLAASLFGLHPINVDSVAWLAERKNVLSTTFWMLSIMAYLRYAKRRSFMRYLPVPACFILGLLTKPSIVALPGVLLLMDFWPLKRIRFEGSFAGNMRNLARGIRAKESIGLIAAEKVPLLALSILSVYVSRLSLQHITVPTSVVPMTLRFENAVVSCVKYLGKMLLPVDLTFFYPYPVLIPVWKVAGAAAIVLAITFFCVKEMSRRPFLLFGWLWYLGTIFPVLGIMQGGQWPQIAERWAYIPFIGGYIALSWGAVEIIGHLKAGAGVKAAAAAAAAVASILFLSGMTWNQIGYWKDDYSLYTHGIKVNPENFVAQNNLGSALLAMDRVDEAVVHYTRAIDISPDFPEPNYNLGVLYLRQKNPDKALGFLRRAIQLNPKDSDAYMSLGILSLERGSADEAVSSLLVSQQLNPHNPEICFNLGMAYYRKGDLATATGYFSRTVRIDPHYAEAHYNLGVIFVNQMKIQEAVDQFSRTVALNPRHKEAHYNLGKAFSDLGRMNQSISHYAEALKIDPGFTPAQQQLDAENNKKTRIESAVQDLEKGLGARPGDTDALNKLAVYYSLLGKNDQAVSSLKKIISVKPASPDAYYNLACIYAKEARIEESVLSLKKAIGLGFSNWQLLKTDGDLYNIRTTDYYVSLLGRIEQ